MNNAEGIASDSAKVERETQVKKLLHDLYRDEDRLQKKFKEKTKVLEGLAIPDDSQNIHDWLTEMLIVLREEVLLCIRDLEIFEVDFWNLNDEMAEKAALSAGGNDWSFSKMASFTNTQLEILQTIESRLGFKDRVGDNNSSFHRRSSDL
jgi:inactivated superfamily I helicase